jgi:cysteine desulfurase
MSKTVYLDNAATTPLTPGVKKVLFETADQIYGNPSSMHSEGRKARIAVEDARKRIAGHFNCSIGEIFFTSGGTESNNTVLFRSPVDLGIERIITSPVEHPCVLETVKHLTNVEVAMVRTDEAGRCDLGHLEELLKAGPKTLVSLMYINNEIGSINPIAQIGQLCKDHNALFHSDTVQAVGYYPLDLAALDVQFISGSAHKFHGPKGIGFLYISNDVRLQPLLWGGSQERNMRSGTENVPYIQAMAQAMDEAYADLESRKKHIQALRAYAVDSIQDQCPEVRILNADGHLSHYKILNIALPLNERSSLALMNMDIAGVCVSAGSACSSGAEKGSHVFDHLFPGQDLKLIRMSFSHLNTMEEIDRAVSALRTITKVSS